MPRLIQAFPVRSQVQASHDPSPQVCHESRRAQMIQVAEDQLVSPSLGDQPPVQVDQVRIAACRTILDGQKMIPLLVGEDPLGRHFPHRTGLHHLQSLGSLLEGKRWPIGHLLHSPQSTQRVPGHFQPAPGTDGRRDGFQRTEGVVDGVDPPAALGCLRPGGGGKVIAPQGPTQFKGVQFPRGHLGAEIGLRQEIVEGIEPGLHPESLGGPARTDIPGLVGGFKPAQGIQRHAPFPGARQAALSVIGEPPFDGRIPLRREAMPIQAGQPGVMGPFLQDTGRKTDGLPIPRSIEGRSGGSRNEDLAGVPELGGDAHGSTDPIKAVDHAPPAGIGDRLQNAELLRTLRRTWGMIQPTSRIMPGGCLPSTPPAPGSAHPSSWAGSAGAGSPCASSGRRGPGPSIRPPRRPGGRVPGSSG